MKSLFISYRRHDSDAAAGRIHDRLKLKLQSWTIFFDVASIDAGSDFRIAIEAAIAQSSTMVAVIGKNWLGAQNGESRPRIHNADDVVRLELATALRKGLRVIPVLINDARIPDATELPEEILPLRARNAIEIRHSRFDDDFANLLAAIDGERRSGQSRRSSLVRLTWIWFVLAGALLSLTLLFVALAVQFEATGRPIGYWIGTDGAILLLAIATSAGGFVGYFAWKKWFR